MMKKREADLRNILIKAAGKLARMKNPEAKVEPLLAQIINAASPLFKEGFLNLNELESLIEDKS